MDKQSPTLRPDASPDPGARHSLSARRWTSSRVSERRLTTSTTACRPRRRIEDFQPCPRPSFEPQVARHSAPKPFWQSLLLPLREDLSTLFEPRPPADRYPPRADKVSGPDSHNMIARSTTRCACCLRSSLDLYPRLSGLTRSHQTVFCICRKY